MRAKYQVTSLVAIDVFSLVGGINHESLVQLQSMSLTSIGGINHELQIQLQSMSLALIGGINHESQIQLQSM